MKNNVYTVFSYNNYELKIKVYAKEADKVFVLMDELIDKVNLNELTSDLQKDKVSLRIKETLEHTKQINPSKDIYLVFDAENYYYNRKSGTFDFPSEHIVTRDDMLTIYNYILNEEVAKNGYRVVNFNVQSMFKNGDKKISKPIGSQMDKLVVNGEIVYADSTTYYNLNSLIQGTGYRLVEARVGSYLLKDRANLQAKEGIIEIGTEKISFVVNHQDNIKKFSINWGFKKMFETLFESLVDTFGTEISEKAVYFVMDHFPLIEYKYDVMFADGLSINMIIKRFRSILKEYFTYIYDELRRQQIEIEQFYVLIQEYNSVELIELLKEVLPSEISEATFQQTVSYEENASIKDRLAIESFSQMKDFTK